MRSDHRATIERAIADAGPAGATVADLQAATGLRAKMIAYYARSARDTIRTGIPVNQHVRWFDAGHAKAAEAHQAELDLLRDKPRHKWCQETRDRGVELVISAGVNGISGRAASEALGLNFGTACCLLAQAERDGLVKGKHYHRGKKLYFGLQVELPLPQRKKEASKARPKSEHKRPGPKHVSMAARKLAGSLSRKLPSLGQAKHTGPIIVPPHVRVQVCPSTTDTRYTPQHVPKFFARPEYRTEFLGPDTWAAKAYADRT